MSWGGKPIKWLGKEHRAEALGLAESKRTSQRERLLSKIIENALTK